jgi:hypothetical protein
MGERESTVQKIAGTKAPLPNIDIACPDIDIVS